MSYRTDLNPSRYTQESFLYRMINKAFRTGNARVLLLFRSVIGDIQRQLTQEQFQAPVSVFRGQLMSPEEIDKLRRSVGELISINSFLSTSIHRKKAVKFLFYGNIIPDTNHVLFEIEADPHLANVKPFADISRFSQFPDEQEILFMARSIFRIEDVREEGNITVIRLKLCSSEDHDLKELFNHSRNEIGDNTTLHTLGKILWRAGKLDLAEMCCRTYLKAHSKDDLNTANCYHDLAMILEERREYFPSLLSSGKCLKIQQLILPAIHPDIASVYTSRGNVFKMMGNFKNAHISYEKAFNIYKQAHVAEESETVAICLQNMGLVSQAAENYEAALLYYEQALAIDEKILPDSHIQIAKSRIGIGDAHFVLKHYDLAMKYFHLALKLEVKSLPPHHVEIGHSYENIARLYRAKGQMQEALRFYEKALVVFKQSLPHDHTDIGKLEQTIAEVKDN